MPSLLERVKESSDFLRSRFKGKSPLIGVILGSGFGDIAREVGSLGFILYKDIPNFPIPTVPGHEGKLWWGERKERCFAILQGRSHFYEGYSMIEITLPIRVLALWGAKLIIITASAGGVSDSINPGDIVLIKDHINLMGENPLRGINEPTLGNRFVDLSNAYDPKVRSVLKEKFNLKEGVYAALSGPSYETPAEIKALKILGADMVGMSVVPETIVARQMGLKVVGIVGITNKAGCTDEGIDITHENVLDSARKIKDKMREIISFCLEELSVDTI